MVDNINKSFHENIKRTLWRRYKTFQIIYSISLLFSLIITIFTVYKIFTLFDNLPIITYLLVLYFVVAIALNLYGFLLWKSVFKYFENSKYRHSEEVIKKILIFSLFLNPVLYSTYCHAYSGKYDPLLVYECKSNSNKKKTIKVKYTVYLVQLLEKKLNFEEHKMVIFNDKIRTIGVKNLLLNQYVFIVLKQALGIIISILFFIAGYIILFNSIELNDLYLSLSVSQFLGLMVFSTFYMQISGIIEFKRTLISENNLIAFIQTKFLFNGVDLYTRKLFIIFKSINDTYKDINW